MKFIIVEQLACLAHLKHSTQPSKFWIKISIIAVYLQYVALLLPMDGWRMWTYNDGHLKLFQMVAQSQLLVPLLAASSFDFSEVAFGISIFVFMIMWFLIFGLLSFGIYNNSNPKDHYSIRFILFYILILAQTVFQLPMLFLFISQIIFGQYTLNFQDSLLGSQGLVNFIGLLLFSLFVIGSLYCLRSYTFVPYNYFQQRFSGFRVLYFILNAVLATVYFLQDDQTIQYAQIALIHLILILTLIECSIYKPYIPFINLDHIRMSFVAECVTIIVSINVFTKNVLINEEQLLITFLLAGSFGYFLATSYIERKMVEPFDYEITSESCIPFTQEMYFNSQNLTTKQFIVLYFYISSQQNTWKQKNTYIQSINHSLYCILSGEYEKMKRDAKTINEEFFLFYINYLAVWTQKPLLAFSEIKKYESYKNLQSYYFQIIKQQMSNELQSLIVKKQQKLQKSSEEEKQLGIQSILETLQFQEEYLPNIRNIINEKINFWKSQIKGFNNIYDIERLALQQSSNILNLSQKIKSFCKFDVLKYEDHISFTGNAQNIKLISIFYSTIMNDFYGTQICEAQMIEIFNIEHTYSEDIVTNLKLISEKAILIILSLVKNRGKIVNQDQRLIAKYFGYDDQEFTQIENIANLMPYFFGEYHDRLLQEYIQSAKSIFIDDYNLVFSQSRAGMLSPQQLKIDNDCSSLDDYKLIGCLSEIKQSQDFVLFNDTGYLIGCTKNFYETFLKFQNLNPSQINQIRVYVLFPSILDLLNEKRSKLKSELQFGVQDQYCRIWKFVNFKDLMEEDNNITQTIQQLSISNRYDQQQSVQKSRTSAATLDSNKFRQPILIENTGFQVNNKLNQLPIYNMNFQQKIIQFIRFQEEKEKQLHVAKVCLHCKTIGEKHNKKSYFILEINDIKRSNDLNESLANNQFSQPIMSTKQQNSQSMNTEIENSFEQAPIAKEGITPIMLKVNEITPINNQKNLLTPQNAFDVQLYGMDSGRDSMSYAPLSQRIQFISPSSKQQQLQGLIDMEFTDLQMQLECNREFINDVEIQEPSQVKGISNSNDKQERSNNLIELIKENQLHKQREDIEISAKKSRSSTTSGSSGMSAIQVIKKFQQTTNMTLSLQTLSAINITIVITIITYIIIHLTIGSQSKDLLLSTLNNITAPMLFNRYFSKTLCYIWSLVFNSLKIIDSSDYIIIQTIKEISNIAETMLAILRGMYTTFIGIEVSGLLSEINLDFLYQENEKVTYTYFINFVSNVADLLFQAQYYTIYNLDQLINITYLDNMLTLRYNLKNVVKMNTELLDSLNTIYVNLQQQSIEQFQIQISIEIIILSLIMFLQIFYWHQLEKYCQQVILLVGRLQEIQAQEQILRFSYINETLTYISGKQSWKQQNFYKIAYLPLSQLGLDSLKTESRIIKDYQLQFISKDSQNINPIISDHQKKSRKNQSIPMNARITNTNVSITAALTIIISSFIIFMAFILGGYLLFDSQSLELNPTQQLALNFIRFTSQQDITVTSALITKSQKLLYNKLVEAEYYTSEQLESFQEGKALVNIFLTYFDTYFQNLTNIYQYIIESNLINGADESVLLTLYSYDYCLLLSELIPFCNLNDHFIQNYGNYSTNDDNSEYLHTGIQGVVSRMDILFRQAFQYEIEQQDYQTNNELTLSQINTQQFTNAIFEHFLDTTDGTNLFIDNLMQILQDIILNNLNIFYIYYLVSGILLLAIYILFFGIWIYKSNRRLIKLRLILTNLPIETLTEQNTLALLKKLK